MTASDPSFYALTERYPDEASAVRYFEERRWPNGVHCPKCGSVDILRGDNPARNRQLWYCHSKGCETQFSVTSGTVMEFTKLPLRKWMMAFHFIGASKKGISSLQLSRMLGTTYKTAWHLSHRIRATMTNDRQMFSGIVETDELYVGGKRKGRGRGYRGNKIAVQTIVQRNSANGRHDGQAQTIALNNGQKVDGRTVGAKLRTHTDPANTILMTDDSSIYDKVGESFQEHHSVNHSREEYVRCDPDGHLVTTNTAEGLFANLRRQLTGTHHHTSKKHLPKYLEEYDFKYNTREGTDTERTEQAIGNIEGRSLKLFKSESGRGDSLYGHKVNEARPDYIPPADGCAGGASCLDHNHEPPPEPRKRAKRPQKPRPGPGTDKPGAAGACPGPTCPCSECRASRLPDAIDVAQWAAEKDAENAENAGKGRKR